MERCFGRGAVGLSRRHRKPAGDRAACSDRRRCASAHRCRGLRRPRCSDSAAIGLVRAGPQPVPDGVAMVLDGVELETWRRTFRLRSRPDPPPPGRSGRGCRDPAFLARSFRAYRPPRRANAGRYAPSPFRCIWTADSRGLRAVAIRTFDAGQIPRSGPAGGDAAGASDVGTGHRVRVGNARSPPAAKAAGSGASETGRREVPISPTSRLHVDRNA